MFTRGDQSLQQKQTHRLTACCICLLLLLLLQSVRASVESDNLLLDNEQSSFSRSMTSSTSHASYPAKPKIRRSTFPQAENPHVCLAFLSCCDRTDLLNHTMAGIIRHMEEDEPSYLNYEIAWVDNGSNTDMTQHIVDSYQIEHVLRLPHNMGLAYGMNLLIFNLCTAPYILLLEEDWLYLDDLVAPQSPERKRAIATSLAFLEAAEAHNIRAFDEREIMGVFLRHESYESFLKFPLMDTWDSVEGVDIPKQLAHMHNKNDAECQNSSFYASEKSSPVDIDYRLFCADSSFQVESIWGSYTNGAGLYRRSDLMKIGRMFGEPGDTFHDRYVESNYAFRAGLRFCHAAIRLTEYRSCQSIFDPQCTGAFRHIGGGRGTRPMNTKGTTCDDMAWNFYGTRLYDKYHKFVEHLTGQPVYVCSKEELEELRKRSFRDRDAEDYRKRVKEENERVFQKEREEREKLKLQADLVENLLHENPGKLRAEVVWMADKNDEEIRQMAARLRRLADSPHPLEGFWDSHGRVVGEKKPGT